MQCKGVNIYVPTLVEVPQIIIFSLSFSSLSDQVHFIESRKEGLMSLILKTKSGVVSIKDGFLYPFIQISTLFILFSLDLCFFDSKDKELR